MTRIYLYIWVLLMILFLGCYPNENKNDDSSHIVLVGTAVNLKLGAGVISNENTYYIDGVYSWDNKILEKRVRVEGELFVEILSTLPPRDTTSSDIPPPPPQRISAGFMLTVKAPKIVTL